MGILPQDGGDSETHESQKANAEFHNVFTPD
jgi:hypothetical protein